MTYEEAIDYGTSCIDAWESWVKPDAVQMQFYKLAIEAIAKQIPQKPIRYVTAFPSCCMVSKCPNCGQEFGFNTDFNFCENCGQSLDFRSESIENKDE